MPGLLDFIQGYKDGGLLGAFAGYQSPDTQAKLAALRMDQENRERGQQLQQDVNSRYVSNMPWLTPDAAKEAGVDPSMTGAPQYTGQTVFGEKTGMELSPYSRAMFQYTTPDKSPGLLQTVLPQEQNMQVGRQMATMFAPQGTSMPPMLQPQQGAPQPQSFAPSLYKAVEQVESGGNPNAVSPKGALGPMQVMPATAASPGFGVAPFNPSNPQANRQGGQQYLDAMIQKYGPQEGLMAYNWGPGNMDKWIAGGRDPNAVPAETRAYVQKVAQAYQGQQQAPAPQPQGFSSIAQNPAIAPLYQSAMARLAQGDIKGGLDMMTKVIENSPELQGQIAGAKGGADSAARLPFDLAKSRGDAAAKADYELEQVQNPDRSFTKVPRSFFLPKANGGVDQAQMAPGGANGLTTDIGPAAKAQEEATGKFWGETNSTLQKAAMDAQGKDNRLDRISNLLDGINTGTFASSKLALAKALQGVGITNVDARTISKEEAAAALSNEIALSLRDPSSGGGMPGALSDSDRQFLQTMTPGLSTSPEGRKQIIETAKKLNERTVQVAKLARDYKKANNGRLDDGFVDKVEQFAAANPLFPQAPKQNGTSAPAPAGLPQGATQIGTYQGKPVYQTPDGKRLVGQ